MKGLFKRTTTTDGRSPKASLGSRVTLAAFGKHPGWDDHMPGIGVDTELLAHLKQALYVRGIGKQIDSGAWEKLDADKRLEGFDHTFLLVIRDAAVLGQLWSSTDRKGRSKYPMVVCLHVEGVALEILLTKARPELQRFRDACKATNSSGQVTAECGAAQERLRTLLASLPQPPSGPTPPLETRRRFLERREFGPDRLGLLRVMHELDNALGTSIGAPKSKPAGIMDLRPHHLRVPLCGDSRGESLLSWPAFLHCALRSTMPLLLIARGGVNWLDVIIGEAASGDFFCLQASPKALPLATDIPYELAPDQKPRLEQLEAKFLLNEPATMTHAQASPGKTEAASPVSASTGKTESPGSGGKSGRLLGIATLLLIAGGSIWWFIAQRNSSPAPELAATSPANSTQTQLELAKKEEKFQTAMKQGRSAFDGQDYGKAITLAGVALGIKTNDQAAMKLRDEAQRQLNLANEAKAQEQKYLAAITEAKAAFDGKDYAKAIAQAGVALRIKTNDPVATRLKADAETQQTVVLQAAVQQAEREKQFGAATNAAWAAFQAGNFTNAIAEADKALAISPDNPAAKKLKDDAQRQLELANAAQEKDQKFLAAMAEGKSAFEGKDYARAIVQASVALELKPNHPSATKLKDDAQRQLELVNAAKASEQKYQTAMTGAKSAFDEKDYVKAITQAEVALGIKPNDPTASRLKEDAQKQLDLAKTAKDGEQKYQVAMKEGQAAFGRKDYTEAIKQAETAMAIKTNDGAATKLKENALEQLELARNEQAIQRQAVTLQSTNMVSGASKTELAKFDKTLDRWEVWFRMRPPETRILEPNGRPATPLDMGSSISPLKRHELEQAVENLRKAYETRGWLNSERDMRLTKIMAAIQNWSR